MHKFVRPEPTPKFRATMKKARKKVNKQVRTPAPGAVPKWTAYWSDFKRTFAKAQFVKCGFCERSLHGLQYGDVEHYRPKGEVHVLDHAQPDQWGSEDAWGSSVKGRIVTSHSATGYWWLAYRWSNYLLACQVCNQQWKKCLFPISARPAGQAPRPQDVEGALLLNPFSGVDPAEHLEFGRMGEVTAYQESAIGYATILTCGLDRPSLRQARRDLARITHERIDEIGADITDHDLREILAALWWTGQDSQPHCGMVRSIFRQRMDLTWDDLERIILELEKTAAGPARRLCEC